MPTWSGILAELRETTSENRPPDFDGVRRKYLDALQGHTGRQTILYASGWLQEERAPPSMTSIHEEDILALMEVTAGMSSGDLDLILHSPQAILNQFDKAQREGSDPAKLSAWLPMLSQYGPDLLERSEMALQLTKTVVRQWLRTYMFQSDDESHLRADAISNWLANHENFNSHSRHLSREKLKEKGMPIAQLEDDQTFQDLCLSVFHGAIHTFSATRVVKIVESHTGRAFIKNFTHDA